MRAYIENIVAEELRCCAENITYFIEEYCRIEDKDRPGLVIPFHLWKGQREAVEGIMEHRFNIILKARQLGMSWLVLAIALYTLMFHEGSTVVALSRTQKEAQEMVRRLRSMCTEMKEFIGGKGDRRPYTMEATQMAVTLCPESGRKSVFQAFTSNPAAARSFTANLIIFDEWAYQKDAEEIWISGLPTVNRVGGGRVIGLSTMQRGTFFENIWQNSALFHRIFLPWTTDPKRDAKWYADTWKLMGEDIYREYPSTPEEALRAPGGAFFSEIRRHIHVTEPFEIPGHWRRYHAIDYGLDMLASLWAAVDPEGNVYVYREVYESGLIIPDACRRMKEAEGNEEIHIRYAPPDLFGKSSETGRTRAEAFAEGGFSFEKASADRKAGWSNLKEWLRVRENAAGEKTARLKFFSCCENLIRTISALPRDKKTPDDCATEPHELTHAPDALRYLMIQRPMPGAAPDRAAGLWFEEVQSVLDYA